MECTKSIENSALTVSMKGKFTFSDHVMFKDIMNDIKTEPVKRVIFNLEAIEFVDSAALGMLLLARDKAEDSSVTLILKHPKGQVEKMFRVSRFYELFTISQD